MAAPRSASRHDDEWRVPAGSDAATDERGWIAGSLNATDSSQAIASIGGRGRRHGWGVQAGLSYIDVRHRPIGATRRHATLSLPAAGDHAPLDNGSRPKPPEAYCDGGHPHSSPNGHVSRGFCLQSSHLDCLPARILMWTTGAAAICIEDYLARHQAIRFRGMDTFLASVDSRRAVRHPIPPTVLRS